MSSSRRILIDLDTLFDTRLGIILDKHPTLVKRIEPDAYQRRISEVIFETIGIENWHDAYWRKRDVGSLMQSPPTQLMVTELDRILLDEINAITLGAPTDVPKLSFNYYPYKLTKEEHFELKKHLNEWFEKFEVSLGSWCHNHLNPTTLRKNWDCWFCYDYHDWLDVQAPNLGNRIPKFVIYHPSLLHRDMTPETAEMLRRDKVNPFTEAMRFMADYVSTKSLDVGLMSVAQEEDWFTRFR